MGIKKYSPKGKLLYRHPGEGAIFADAGSSGGGTGPTGPTGPKGDNGTNGADGVGVPAGGTIGQVLTKIDATDFNTDWETPSAGGGTGSLIGIQYITTTGAYTYTPTSGTSSIILILQGAGAGGSGVASASASQVNLGGGGGGGAWLQKYLTSHFSGATGSVGAKGAGGASGNNNGSDGGNTTFIDSSGSPTTYTAGGGVHGVFRGSFAAPITADSGAGGVATNGDININGNGGPPGIAPNAFVGWAGGGAGGKYGPFSPATDIVNASSGIGASGTGKGTGGSGAVSANSGGAKAGGDGTDGIVVIYEYA